MSLNFFLNKNVIVLFSLVLGGIFGVFFKEQALFLKPVSDFYLAILKICVLPYVVCSICVSSHAIGNSTSNNKKVGMFVFVSILGLVVCFVLAVISVSLFEPWSNIRENEMVNTLVGREMYKSVVTVSADEVIKIGNQTSISEFLINLVPANIFQALAGFSIVQVVVFFVFFGFWLSKIKSAATDSFVRFLKLSVSVLGSINSYMTKFIPIGVFFLVSSQITGIDPSVLVNLLSLLLSIYAVTFTLIVISLICLAYGCSMGFFRMLRALSDSFICLLSTLSVLIALPKVIDELALIDKKSDFINSALPFGIVIARYGSFLVFVVCTFFVAKVFSMDVTPIFLLKLFVGAFAAALSTSGMIGANAAIPIVYAFDLVGAPGECFLPIFLVCEMFFEYAKAPLTFAANCGIVVFLDRFVKDTPKKDLSLCEVHEPKMHHS